MKNNINTFRNYSVLYYFLDHLLIFWLLLLIAFDGMNWNDVNALTKSDVIQTYEINCLKYLVWL